MTKLSFRIRGPRLAYDPDELYTFIKENPCLTIAEVAAKFNISMGAVQGFKQKNKLRSVRPPKPPAEPSIPERTEQQIFEAFGLTGEEISNRNMLTFYMGTPFAELPKGVRHRRQKELTKMYEIRPIEGFETAPEMGHPVPIPALGELVNIEEVKMDE